MEAPWSSRHAVLDRGARSHLRRGGEVVGKFVKRGHPKCVKIRVKKACELIFRLIRQVTAPARIAVVCSVGTGTPVVFDTAFTK